MLNWPTELLKELTNAAARKDQAAIRSLRAVLTHIIQRTDDERLVVVADSVVEGLSEDFYAAPLPYEDDDFDEGEDDFFEL